MKKSDVNAQSENLNEKVGAPEVSDKVIQPQLSDKAFKYLYSWDELRNRTKDAAWLYDQIKEMLEKGENLEEVEKMIVKLENDIKKFSEFYRKRFEIKLGYLRTRLNELTK